MSVPFSTTAAEFFHLSDFFNPIHNQTNLKRNHSQIFSCEINFYHTPILSGTAFLLPDDDFKNIGSIDQSSCTPSPIRGARILNFPETLARPTHPQAIFHYFPCQSDTPHTFRSLSQPNINSF